MWSLLRKDEIMLKDSVKLDMELNKSIHSICFVNKFNLFYSVLLTFMYSTEVDVIC